MATHEILLFRTSAVKKIFGFFLLLTAAFFSFRCSFNPDNSTLFVQQPVPPVTLHAQVQQTFGAAPAQSPQYAFAYQLYFSAPATQVVVPVTAINFFPSDLYTRCTEILPAIYLNRGFALGYGDYVLGAAFLIAFDDTNHNGAFDAGEPLIGSSANEVLVYFQGTATQDLIDQFGALQQGYNLCEKTTTILGVDVFRTVAMSSHTAVVNIPKASGSVVLPKLR